MVCRKVAHPPLSLSQFSLRKYWNYIRNPFGYRKIWSRQDFWRSLIYNCTKQLPLKSFFLNVSAHSREAGPTIQKRHLRKRLKIFFFCVLLSFVPCFVLLFRALFFCFVLCSFVSCFVLLFRALFFCFVLCSFVFYGLHIYTAGHFLIP